MGQDNPFNGMTVLGRYNNTLYIRIPYELAKDCNGCDCPYCKAHPDLIPKWDVMAVSCKQGDYGFTWTVHMPQVSEFIQQATQKDAEKRRAKRRAGK